MLKGAASRSWILNFSKRSFVIRFNLLYPSPSWPYLYLFLSLWLFSFLINCYFAVFHFLNAFFTSLNNDPKYRDRGPLTLSLLSLLAIAHCTESYEKLVVLTGKRNVTVQTKVCHEFACLVTKALTVFDKCF